LNPRKRGRTLGKKKLEKSGKGKACSKGKKEGGKGLHQGGEGFQGEEKRKRKTR